MHSVQAFHVNIVAVYTLPHSKLPIQEELLKPGVKWTNDHHTGSIHQVICADIDGDGEDELLAPLMGADPADQRRTGV
jgi:hypothetical protein